MIEMVCFVLIFAIAIGIFTQGVISKNIKHS